MTWNCRNRNRTIPRPRRRKHTVGVLDGVHVSIVAFNHVDGSSHLLSEEIHVHAFLQSERGVGVPEAIRRTRNALRAFAQIRLVQEVANQTAIKSFCGLARDVGEDSVIRLRGFGDHPDAFQILSDTPGSHQLARFTLALNKQHDNLAPFAVFCRHHVAPAQILHLRWPHACIASYPDHGVGAGPIPDAGRLVRLRNSLAAYGVELAVFLQCELVAPHGLELWTLIKTLAGRNVAFLDGVIHHRTEDGHFKADGGITDKGNHPFIGRGDFNRPQNPDAESLLNFGAALRFLVREGLRHVVADFPNAVALGTARAVLPLPCRIAAPKLITDKVDLR